MFLDLFCGLVLGTPPEHQFQCLQQRKRLVHWAAHMIVGCTVEQQRRQEF